MKAYYEFDMGRIHRRLDYLRSLLGRDIALAYAVKANTFIIEDMIENLKEWSGKETNPGD